MVSAPAMVAAIRGGHPFAEAVEGLDRPGELLLAAPGHQGGSGAEQRRHQRQRPRKQGEGEQEKGGERHIGESGEVGGAQRLLGTLDAAHQFGALACRPPVEGVGAGSEHQPEDAEAQPLVGVADDLLGQAQAQAAKDQFGADGDGYPGGEAGQGAADAVADVAVQHLDDIERRHQPQRVDHQRRQQQIGRRRPVPGHPRDEFGHGSPSRLSFRRGGGRAAAAGRPTTPLRRRPGAAASSRCRWRGSAPRCGPSPR